MCRNKTIQPCLRVCLNISANGQLNSDVKVVRDPKCFMCKTYGNTVPIFKLRVEDIEKICYI